MSEQWTNVTDKLPERGGAVLIAYLKPFFGIMTYEQTVAYYDSPNDYTDGDGKGWLLWYGPKGSSIHYVTHWMPLPDVPITPLDGINQADFMREYTEDHFHSVRPI